MAESDLIALSIVIFQEESLLLQSQADSKSTQNDLGSLPALRIQAGGKNFETRECGFGRPDIGLVFVFFASIVEILLNV